MSAQKTRPVCRYCGSKNINLDATARWSPQKGDWVLAGLMDSGSCGDCGELSKYFNWIPINRRKRK